MLRSRIGYTQRGANLRVFPPIANPSSHCTWTRSQHPRPARGAKFVLDQACPGPSRQQAIGAHFSNLTPVEPADRPKMRKRFGETAFDPGRRSCPEAATRKSGSWETKPVSALSWPVGDETACH